MTDCNFRERLGLAAYKVERLTLDLPVLFLPLQHNTGENVVLFQTFGNDLTSAFSKRVSRINVLGRYRRVTWAVPSSGAISQRPCPGRTKERRETGVRIKPRPAQPINGAIATD